MLLNAWFFLAHNGFLGVEQAWQHNRCTYSKGKQIDPVIYGHLMKIYVMPYEIRTKITLKNKRYYNMEASTVTSKK